MKLDGDLSHGSHPGHQLLLKEELIPFVCDGCKEIGFGPRYACEKQGCDFDLHKDCATPPDTVISHPFFPGCRFRFLLVAPAGKGTGRYCDACGEDIKGSVYHCADKGWDLHPTCANLPRELEAGDVTLKLQRRLSVQCDKCGHKDLENIGSKSWCYVSECSRCHLHVACVKKMQVDKCRGTASSSGGGSRTGVEAQTNQALVSRTTPDLRIVIDDGRRKKGKFDKFLKILKMVISAVLSVVLGNPAPLAADPISIVFN